MDNERRDNPRMPVALDVALYYSALRLPDCQTRDISLEGAYVHTGGRALPHKAAIDVAFTLHVGEEIRYHRLPAEVMRVDHDGLGLMFRYPDYSSLNALVNLLDAG
ncbi:MAG: PilZ domain-containing protein [Gammaproteobacteria bacterium]|nr:PilZ domain-containing protein [Gammaproteobacteria bacterium]